MPLDTFPRIVSKLFLFLSCLKAPSSTSRILPALCSRCWICFSVWTHKPRHGGGIAKWFHQHLDLTCVLSFFFSVRGAWVSVHSVVWRLDTSWFCRVTQSYIIHIIGHREQLAILVSKPLLASCYSGLMTILRIVILLYFFISVMMTCRRFVYTVGVSWW